MVVTPESGKMNVLLVETLQSPCSVLPCSSVPPPPPLPALPLHA